MYQIMVTSYARPARLTLTVQRKTREKNFRIASNYNMAI